MQADYGAMFRVIAKAVSDDLEGDLSSNGISFTELRFLRYVQVAGRPVRIKELEEYYDYAFPTVAGAIKSLERRGMVDLIPDDTDRRVRLVQVSDKGAVAVDSLVAAMDHIEAGMLRGLSDEDRDVLAHVLDKVFDNVRGDRRYPMIPRTAEDIEAFRNRLRGPLGILRTYKRLLMYTHQNILMRHVSGAYVLP